MLILVGLLFLYTNSLHRSYFAGRTQRHELIECVVYEAIVEHTKKIQGDLRENILGLTGPRDIPSDQEEDSQDHEQRVSPMPQLS